MKTKYCRKYCKYKKYFDYSYCNYIENFCSFQKITDNLHPYLLSPLFQKYINWRIKRSDCNLNCIPSQSHHAFRWQSIVNNSLQHETLFPIVRENMMEKSLLKTGNSLNGNDCDCNPLRRVSAIFLFFHPPLSYI